MKIILMTLSLFASANAFANAIVLNPGQTTQIYDTIVVCNGNFTPPVGRCKITDNANGEINGYGQCMSGTVALILNGAPVFSQVCVPVDQATTKLREMQSQGLCN